MAEVTIIGSNFTGNYTRLNGNTRLNISKLDIARGLVSIGKLHWLEYFKEPRLLLNDLIHHYTGVNNYIQTRNGMLCATNRLYSLDASDLRLKVYNIGMGIAKIVAERILDIPYLQHVDYLLKHNLAVLNGGTNKRGDMAGLDRNSNWHAIEAKGSSDMISNSEFRYAKEQVNNINLINGLSPHTKNVCFASISPNMIIVYLQDPNDEVDEKAILEIDRKKFVASYYHKIYDKINNLPIINYNSDFPQIEQFSPIYYKINDQYYIGIFSEVIEGINSDNTDFVEKTAIYFESIKNITSERLSVGSDGIILVET